MDFTIKIYKKLLLALINEGYSFITLKEYTNANINKYVILRHDVDKHPEKALVFAKMQAKNGIKGSYYFRTVEKSWDERIIKQIASLGHEIGYHYENMDECNGNIDKAWDDFKFNLNKLRKIVDVKTICMHGSPRSKYDNKEIWKKYDYNPLNIICEPYFDINFDEVFYLTDTGHRWDGWKTSVRDKVHQQKKWINQGQIFHSTQDIINSIEKNRFPRQVLFTFHPQRWHKCYLLSYHEMIIQKLKNIAKRVLVSKNK